MCDEGLEEVTIPPGLIAKIRENCAASPGMLKAFALEEALGTSA